LSFLGIGPIQLRPSSGDQGLPTVSTTVLPVHPDAATKVPAVKGLPEAYAAAALRHAGFVVRIQYTPATDGEQVGMVIGQGPTAGTPLRPGATVAIVVGTTAGVWHATRAELSA
jgi:beta-lactam-binding protein with PASTA domain